MKEQYSREKFEEAEKKKKEMKEVLGAPSIAGDEYGFSILEGKMSKTELDEFFRESIKERVDAIVEAEKADQERLQQLNLAEEEAREFNKEYSKLLASVDKAIKDIEKFKKEKLGVPTKEEKEKEMKDLY